MNFSLSSSIDSDRIFIARSSSLAKRWDPFYHVPSLVNLETRVTAKTPLTLRHFIEKMAGGSTPSTKNAEEHYTDGSEGIPFIRVQNLTTKGVLILEDCKRITRSTHEGLLNRSRLSGGELLVKITGVGRMAVASVVPDNFEGNINQHLVAIKTKNRATSESLAAWLNLDVAEKLASRRATGGTRPALDHPALKSIPVISDSRIALLMNKAVARSESKIAKAKQLLESIDKTLLDRLGITLPKEPPSTVEDRIFCRRFAEVTGRRYDPLYFQRDILFFIRSCREPLVPLKVVTTGLYTGFPAGRGDQGEEENGIIHIRPTNLSEERELIFNRNVYIDSESLVKRKNDLLIRDEVLFNNTNSQEQVGKTAYFNQEGNFFCSNHITRIRTAKQQLLPRFLYYLLNLYQRKGVFYKSCTNWNNQSGIGSEVLQSLLIPVPSSLDVQKNIIQELDNIRELSFQLRNDASDDLSSAKREIEGMVLGEGESAK